MDARWRPIDRWEGPETDRRHKTPFDAAWSRVMRDLERELGHLEADNVVILVDIAERDVRLDGTLRAGVDPKTPRVVLGFTSKHGSLRYQCDAFTTWRANLRAIGLGLEGLRRIERYGIVTGGQQYRGWSAIGAGGTALGARSTSPAEAARVLLDLAEEPQLGAEVETVIADRPATGGTGDIIAYLHRRAVHLHHPDHGGHLPHLVQTATEARDVLLTNTNKETPQ